MTIQFSWILSPFQLFPSYFPTTKYIVPANILPQEIYHHRHDPTPTRSMWSLWPMESRLSDPASKAYLGTCWTTLVCGCHRLGFLRSRHWDGIYCAWCLWKCAFGLNSCRRKGGEAWWSHWRSQAAARQNGHLWGVSELQEPLRVELGDFLVVWWLRICLPRQGVQVRCLVGELRSHMPGGQNIIHKVDAIL